MPMFGVVIAFKDYNYFDGIFGSDWVGFKYFEYFFTSNDAAVILRNTIGYNLVFLFLRQFFIVYSNGNLRIHFVPIFCSLSIETP